MSRNFADRTPHTAEHIQQSMEKMLNNWRIDKQRVHVILRDNAANMKKAMRDMGCSRRDFFKTAREAQLPL